VERVTRIRRRWWGSLVGLLVLAVGALFFHIGNRGRFQGDSPSEAAGQNERDEASRKVPLSVSNEAESNDGDFTRAAPDLSIGTWTGSSEQLREILRDINALPLEDRWEVLKDFLSDLTAENPEAMAALLQEVLDSGIDFETNVPFEVGVGGGLLTAPSLRTALLDLLGQINPAAAAAYSEVIFDSSTNAAEWALALRNEGRSLKEPHNDAAFTEHLVQYLENPEWASAPSRGYFEGFDAAVYHGGPQAVDGLLKLRKDATSRSVRRVSTMALLNLAATPSESLGHILQATISPEDATGRELRATLFATFDPREPGEQTEVEAYLRWLHHEQTAAGKQEVTQFLERFPNHHRFGAPRLLTAPPLLSLPEQAQRDVAALALVEKWRGEATDTEMILLLDASRDRLTEWVEAARQAGFVNTP
jgi:hypothetical protein